MAKDVLKIPFNKISCDKTAKQYLTDCIDSGIFENGGYGKKASLLLEQITQSPSVFLTPSCTSALEMSALLLGIGSGDEVIMPSYTFVSTANAFVLHGATPVFVDIRADTLNLDEQKIEEAITSKTKAIVAVHYAGVACDMNSIMSIAKKHNLYVIEDAAQGIMAKYEEKHLGSIGHLGTLSFHHTKNITAGLGGALLVNDPSLVDAAKTIWQKGTNREAFLEGQVDKYTWVSKGSSYMLNEMSAAVLLSQLENREHITKSRLQIWNKYHKNLAILEEQGVAKLPNIPKNCQHNAHIFYLILNSHINRKQLIEAMKQAGVQITFHYSPLHSSPAGEKYGKVTDPSGLKTTENIKNSIVRLPIFHTLSKEESTHVIETIIEAFDGVATALLDEPMVNVNCT
jgi:dTDP-4-amino-4,6-dideoxygalactose transaminase